MHTCDIQWALFQSSDHWPILPAQQGAAPPFGHLLLQPGPQFQVGLRSCTRRGCHYSQADAMGSRLSGRRVKSTHAGKLSAWPVCCSREACGQNMLQAHSHEKSAPGALADLLLMQDCMYALVGPPETMLPQRLTSRQRETTIGVFRALAMNAIRTSALHTVLFARTAETHTTSTAQRQPAAVSRGCKHQPRPGSISQALSTCPAERPLGYKCFHSVWFC